MDEYLTFLSFALHIAEKKTLSPEDIDLMFLDYFISKKDSYSNSENYGNDNLIFSILPIFSGLVFINTKYALEYERCLLNCAVIAYEMAVIRRTAKYMGDFGLPHPLYRRRMQTGVCSRHWKLCGCERYIQKAA